MKTPLFIFYCVYRTQFLLETMPFLNTLVSSQVRRAIPSSEEATPRSREDASTKRINSKRQPIASKAPSKFFSISSLILIYSLLGSKLTREHSTKRDQTSSEDTVKPRCLTLIHALMKSGPLLSERLISSQTPELNQMPTLNFLCKKSKLITTWQKLQEPAQSLVDFRLILNCLMRPRGELRLIPIQTSSVLNTEIDIIKLSPSTKKPWLILTAESTKKRMCMTSLM